MVKVIWCHFLCLKGEKIFREKKFCICLHIWNHLSRLHSQAWKWWNLGHMNVLFYKIKLFFFPIRLKAIYIPFDQWIQIHTIPHSHDYIVKLFMWCKTECKIIFIVVLICNILNEGCSASHMLVCFLLILLESGSIVLCSLSHCVLLVFYDWLQYFFMFSLILS